MTEQARDKRLTDLQIFTLDYAEDMIAQLAAMCRQSGLEKAAAALEKVELE